MKCFDDRPAPQDFSPPRKDSRHIVSSREVWKAADERMPFVGSASGRGDLGFSSLETSATDEQWRLALCIKEWLFLSYKNIKYTQEQASETKDSGIKPGFINQKMSTYEL